jgi:hypothetical protein
MANNIRLKRSASTNTPSSLLQGEPANSESGSPNGINEFFIGTTGPTVFKLVRNLNGSPAEPTAGLATTAIAATDYIPFEDVTDSQAKRTLISNIPLSYFNDDLVSGNYVTAVTGGTGITVTGTTSVTVNIDYNGTDNFIDAATNLEGTAIASNDTIIYHDATDNNVKKGLVSDLPISGGDANLADNETVTGSWTFDGVVTTADFGTGGRVKDGTDVSRPMGFNVMPVYEIDANDTFDLAHNGFLWHKDSGVAVTFTCANDTDIPQGATYVVHNDDTENLTIAQGTGVTLAWLEAGAAPVTGNVTVAQGGIVTVYKYSDTEFWAWGSKESLAAVSSVGAGVGLTNSGTGTDPVLNFDFTELTDMTGAISGTTEFILNDAGTESRKAASEIGLEFFDDSNYLIDEDNMASNSATRPPSQQSVKAYVDAVAASEMTYKGGFDPTAGAGAGSPNLNSITSAVGDMYTVTVAGTYNFTTGADPVLEVGDVLISEVAGVNSNGDNWTVVQKNIDVIDGGTF